jgi:hypothetical protein
MTKRGLRLNNSRWSAGRRDEISPVDPCGFDMFIGREVIGMGIILCAR